MNAGETGINGPIVTQRHQHSISRSNMSENALKVLYRLKNSGYQAFMVGGGVRDLLLSRKPKDFDIATNAHPEDIRRIFRNCRIIGRRFKLAHVCFANEIVEVATFRAPHTDALNDGETNNNGSKDVSGRILRDNVFGDIEEDAWRRDFTINALYYNINDFSVLDYTGGMADLAAKQLRLIGDPAMRYREDPVRMLRAIRFATKLGFSLHTDTEQPLWQLGKLLQDIPPARLFDEILKLLLRGQAVHNFEQLRHYKLFGFLFPDTEKSLEVSQFHAFVMRALENSDQRVADGKSISPGFLYSVLLWGPVAHLGVQIMNDGSSELEATQKAILRVISKQAIHTAVPKRFSQPMREIWLLQRRFDFRIGKKPLRLLAHPRFRAAYDFLALRAAVGEAKSELVEWWTTFQEAKPTEQTKMICQHNVKGRHPRRIRTSGKAVK